MATAAVDRPVAMITGAGRGIGRATAEAFAAAGHAVVIAEVQPALGRRAAHALRAHGAEVLALVTDVTRPASVRRAVAAARSRFGRIDCLVNNAGVLTVGPLARLAEGALERMLAVNLRGPLLATRAVLPAMLGRRSGAIVNVASLLGRTGAGDYATYCATKFGVVGFTEALGEELRGTGVGVWAVCPGLVDTMMARKTGITAGERSRLIRPESVARVIVDLATGRRREPSGAAVDVVR
jgi:NAD(P)-dependent dehydrogenase (short-subunit alcohol dehydrogenase family)